MDKITVNKNKLIEIIKNNRSRHIEEYKESWIGYKSSYELYLKKLSIHIQRELDSVRKNLYTTGVNLDFYFKDPEPVSHEEDYNSIISMLELHSEDTVELSFKDHELYVRDNWAWKKEFVRTSSLYK